MADITIKLIADTDAAIPLHVDSPTSVGMTVSEAFIDRGDVPEYTGAYTVTPSASVQTLPTNGLMMTDDVTVGSMSIDLQAKTVNPSTTAATVSPDAGYDGLSSVTVNAMPEGLLALPETAYSDRLGVAYIDVTVGVDDDGYVDSSDGFTYPVKVNDIPSLPKQTATTITPTTSVQTAVAAKKWTTGDVKVGAIPSQYIVPSGTVAITANTSSANVKTYEFASVSVPNTYTASDEGKVVSSGTLVSQTSDTCTSNGVVDTTLINSLTVNVSGGGGGGTTKIADGTFTGAGGAWQTISFGKKMPQTDFLVVIWVANGTTINPVNSTNRAWVWYQYLCKKGFAHYDLSSDGTKSPISDLTYPTIGSDGVTTTDRSPNPVISQNGGFVRQTTQAVEGVGNVNIVRNSDGFKWNNFGKNAQYIWVTGVTYNWALYYIGSDPTTDIVEVP